MGVSPTNLSLPRMVIGDRAFRDALGHKGVASPGMFVLDPEDNHLYQWVMDHWEGVGAWVNGRVDDPLANYQHRNQGWGGHTAGGGGPTPPPAGPGINPINQPIVPTFTQFAIADNVATPHTAQAITAVDGILTLSDILLAGVPPRMIQGVFVIPMSVAIAVPGAWNLTIAVGTETLYQVVGFAGAFENFATNISFGVTKGPSDFSQWVDGNHATVKFQVTAGTYTLFSRGGFLAGGGYS